MPKIGKNYETVRAEIGQLVESINNHMKACAMQKAVGNCIDSSMYLNDAKQWVSKINYIINEIGSAKPVAECNSPWLDITVDKHADLGNRFCVTISMTELSKQIAEKARQVSEADTSTSKIAHATKPVPASLKVAATLTERSRYGSFKDKASWIQLAKVSIRGCPSWNSLTPAEQEALDAIMVKMARILFGESHLDNWLDIAGYATLIVDGD